MKTPNQLFADYSASKYASVVANFEVIANLVKNSKDFSIDLRKFNIHDVCMNETNGQWKNIQVTKVFIGFHPHFGGLHLCIGVKQEEDTRENIWAGAIEELDAEVINEVRVAVETIKENELRVKKIINDKRALIKKLQDEIAELSK